MTVFLEAVRRLEAQLMENIMETRECRQLERRVVSLDLETKRLGSMRDDDVNRLQAAIDSVRQTVHAVRGGRPSKVDVQAQEVGSKLIQAMTNPTDLARVIAELQELQASISGGSGPANGGFTRTNSPV